MTAGSGFCALYIVIAGAPAIIVTACFGQKPDSRPREINPGGPGRAPSDAVVLFDGKDMSHWTTRDGKPARCQVQSGEMVCLTGVGDIYSREKFRSAQIHLEFAIPFMPEQKDQMRGNSGVYLHGKYEIQILDSYHNPTYAVGACGAIYGQSPPLVNASRPPEQWRVPKCSASAGPREDREKHRLRRGRAANAIGSQRISGCAANVDEIPRYLDTAFGGVKARAGTRA